MKKRVYFTIVFLSILLTMSCSKKEIRESDDIPKEKILMSMNLNNTGEEKAVTVYEPVTGDILTVAQNFAKDLADEEYDKLLKAYSYDSSFSKDMSAEDTWKMVLFYNNRSGRVRYIREAYSLVIGEYRFVHVPLQCTDYNYNLVVTFDSSQKISGFSYGKYAEKRLTIEKNLPVGAEETEYNFTSGGYRLSGTLTLPAGDKPAPVVLLVQGFGALDRDESIYDNKPMRDIAWGLAKLGIASFRYDKRAYTYGEKVLQEPVSLEEEGTEDVISAFGFLKQLHRINTSKIFILGHSMGGYLIPEIAGKLKEPAGYIMLAAPVKHRKDTLLNQYRYLAEKDGSITAEEKEILAAVEKEITLLEDPVNIPDNEILFGAGKAYWIALEQYNPIKKAKAITAPVFVIQGERDYQVALEEFRLWKKYFKAKDNWSFQSYKNLNHFMIYGDDPSDSAEYRRKAYVDDEVIKDISKFIKKKKAK